MAEALTLRGIEEIEDTADAFSVPEFAKMVIRHRDQTCSVFPKIATKLTFPSANVLMLVDHSEPEIKLVLLNLNMGGCVGDILRIELTDLPPEEETDEDV